MAVEHAGNDKVKAAFVEHAEHSDITDDNKDALLLLCACLGLASRVRAVLQAGANAGHINQVRVRARFRGMHAHCMRVYVRTHTHAHARLQACMHGEGIYADRVRARERSGIDEHTDLTC